MSEPMVRRSESRELELKNVMTPEQRRRAEEMAQEGIGQAADLDKIEQYLSGLHLDGTSAEERDILFARLRQELGDRLRWKNVSCNFKMMNDVELLFASRYDIEFVRTHQVVAGLIDTAIILAREGKIASLGESVSRIIYEDIDGGADGYNKSLTRNRVDEKGEETGGVVDLFDELHLRHIKEVYETIPVADRPQNSSNTPMTWAEVEAQYRNEKNENFLEQNAQENGKTYTRKKPVTPISFFIPLRDNQGDYVMHPGKNVPQGRMIRDLFQEVERFTITKEEFAEYYHGIERYQTALQDLSTMRNQSTADHHSEKAGHAQLMEAKVGLTMYLPASVEQAKSYALGDVPKTPVSFRAQGHVHEYSKGYDENSGISVGWSRELFMIFRGKVSDHYAFGQTRERNYKAAMALSQREQPKIDKQNNIFWFGRKRDASTGQVEYGGVYGAMGNHYDALYTEQRGYAMTEYEKGDKVFTDIVGMHFALNARDWIMSYYSATGLASAEESMRGGRAVKDNESGKPTFVFFTKLPGAGKADIGNDVELPDGVDSNLFGEVRINGFTALAKYVAWRVSLGDIPEVTDVKEVEVDIMQTLSRAAAKEGKKPVDTPEEKENKEAVEKGIQSDHRVDAPLFGSLLGECFGSQWVQIIHILSGHDGSLKVSIGGKEVEITSESELLDYLHKAIEEKQNLLQQLKETSKELGTKQAVKYFINALKKVALEQDMLTPDLLKVQVAAPGAQDVIFQKPKAKSAPAPKPVVDSPSEDIV